MKIKTLLICAVISIFSACTTNSSSPFSTGSVSTTTTPAKINNDVAIPGNDTAKIGALDFVWDSASLDNERPQHSVAIAPFNMSQFEITINDFAANISYGFKSLPSTNPPYLDTLLRKDSSSKDTFITRTYMDKGLYTHGDTLYFTNSSLDTVPIWHLDSTHVTFSKIVSSKDTNGSIYLCTTSVLFNPVDIERNKPVTQVSWYGAALFCNFKSDSLSFNGKCYNTSDWTLDSTKPGYRLPSEAEWEWAARSGLGYFESYFPTGRTINFFMANYRIPNLPTVLGYVGVYPANPYGLYDMAGNVWEWCGDLYKPDYNSNTLAIDSLRVLRGGSFEDDASVLRTTFRSYALPNRMDPAAGFRIVRRN